MSKTKKVLLIIGASLLVLLVLSNSFFIYLLATSYQADNMTPDPYQQMSLKKQVLLSYDPDSSVDPEAHKELIAQTLKDSPGILRTEPIILIANPDLKPLIAEILEEDPSILEDDPFTLYDYPELMEINPDLKPILIDVLEKSGDPDAIERFSNKL